MRFAQWFSRGGKAPVQSMAPESASSRPATGRVSRDSATGSLRHDAVAQANLMFGRRLVHAPSGWLGAPCAGVVSAALAGRHLAGSEDEFCVSFAPGWGLGVLPELSARFFLIEAKALISGAWAGVLEPGGEHLLAELLALVELAQELNIPPVFIDNVEVLPSQVPGSFSIASALEKLRGAVPAVISVQTLSEETSVAPSPVLQEILTYWREGNRG